MLKLVQPSARSQWWFDDYRRPNIDWALLQVDEQGRISVFNMEGELHFFTTVREAEVWLTICGFGPVDELLDSTSTAMINCEDLFNELVDGIPTPKLRLVK